jgi:3-deoxy-manno-octulosonate cytidylyltransferase (CMP-KDO synthetase)
MSSLSDDAASLPQCYAIGIIPARYASSRLPGKPLSLIAGKPMIQRTYERAQLSSTLRRVVVATDDERIVQCVRAFGGDAVLTPADCATGSDRCWSVLAQLDGAELARIDVVVNVQGDEPLVDPAHIDLLVAALRAEPAIPIAACCAPLHDEASAVDRNVTKVVMDARSNAVYFSRALVPHSKSGRWSASTAYFRNCGMYAYRTPFLRRYCEQPIGPLQAAEDLEQLKVLEMGERMKMCVVPFVEPGIDTPEQLAAMDARLRQQQI